MKMVAEMQKVADAADISVFLGHLGNFGSFLGQFG